MAHLAKLGGLTDELLTSLTSKSSKTEAAKSNAQKESALRAFRYNNYARTNQFDVASQLEGLEEKFRVYNEDPLADALKERVDKVMKLQSKWTPEILHLLLELSDRPLQNSKLEDLDFLKEPEPYVEPLLRWKDLVAEDPLLREKSVWRNVDFGAESSEDEEFDDGLSERSEATEVTIQSSIEDVGRQPDDYVIDVSNNDTLLALKDAQFWLKDPSVGGVKLDTVKKPITELQAIREVLFMLSGYPTSLFETPSNQSAQILPSKSYVLKHASPDAFYQQISAFAEQGSAIRSLRLWVAQPQSIPLLQVFQDAVSKRIASFDNCLSDIQTRYVELANDVVVSLVQIQTEVYSTSRPLLKLVDIINKLGEERYSHAFRYLEILYKYTCTSQLAGDEELYKFIGTLFFDCFQVFLRPIRAWMEDGDVTPGDKVFFVSRTTGEVDPATIWQSQFKLRHTQDGKLHAPTFLRASVNKIFTTGKSVVVLKQLKKFSPRNHSESDEPLLDFESVCNPQNVQLAPFTELFAEAFDAWIQSKHHHASTTLRRILFDSCGLSASLEALSYVYFMSDGTNGAAFTYPIFDKLDKLDSSWNDRFNLTELLHDSFGTLPSVNPDRLRTSVLALSRKNQDIAKYRTKVKVLSIIEIKYHLSWPVQIILNKESLVGYQRIFTFLFQIRRSSHIITRRRLVSDTLTTSSSSDERLLFYSLRTRLLWFIQTLYYYLSCLVVEPGSSAMRTALKEAVDIDTMIKVHSAFMKSILDKALLGSKLALIHKTILKILDLAIKLEDAETVNASTNKGQREEQANRMDLSMASLGLHTPRKAKQDFKSSTRLSKSPRFANDSSDEDEEKVDLDFSILSSPSKATEVEYVEQLRSMKVDFDRLVRFVASGLRGVARAGGGDEARSWDTLGEMLEAGLGTTTEFPGSFR